MKWMNERWSVSQQKESDDNNVPQSKRQGTGREELSLAPAFATMLVSGDGHPLQLTWPTQRSMAPQLDVTWWLLIVVVAFSTFSLWQTRDSLSLSLLSPTLLLVYTDHETLQGRNEEMKIEILQVRRHPTPQTNTTNSGFGMGDVKTRCVMVLASARDFERADQR